MATISVWNHYICEQELRFETKQIARALFKRIKILNLRLAPLACRQHI
jgi:hypothetical protein